METKICKKCGRELSIDYFKKTKWAGVYSNTCRECAESRRKSIGGGYVKALDKKTINEKFSNCTSRELIEELANRGYKWNEMWIEEVKIEKKFVKI